MLVSDLILKLQHINPERLVFLEDSMSGCHEMTEEDICVAGFEPIGSEYRVIEDEGATPPEGSITAVLIRPSAGIVACW